MKRIVPLLGIALLLMPAAAAQEIDAFSITSEGASAMVFPPGETTSIPVSVTVGCAHVVAAGAEGLDVAVTVVGVPEDWGAQGTTISFSADPECITGTQGSLTESGSVTITPTDNATAVEEVAFSIDAAGGEESDSFAFPASWVEYTPDHSFATNVTFPYTFTEADDGVLEFTLTLEIGANADTMVMFENIDANGTVTGLSYQYYMPSQGDFERTKVMPITWTPPSRAWTSDNITFMSYSHCNGEEPCDPAMNKTPDVTYRWQINNGLTTAGNGGGNGKESPGVGLLVFVGLAVALVARRR